MAQAERGAVEDPHFLEEIEALDVCRGASWLAIRLILRAAFFGIAGTTPLTDNSDEEL